ncbi:hypothetical protein ONE63_011243 [Megalurothrips usitatus]|uniref:Reverse transcriptase domain-containing protein n=1 Tax=Megalurothrips usitatus TaxID=439358 RepID=A0AAV7X561_9NEOP|nr:hypothetical protein ONE63_011243 [Megalurothrips usitatus]
MKIITINLCAATSAAKLEALRCFLVQHNAAVVLLQEVALPVLNIRGYAELVTVGEARRGTAILVRDDLELTPLLALPSGRGCAAKVAVSPRTAVDAALIKDTKAEILGVHAVMLEGVKQRAALDSVLQDEPVSVAHVTKAARRARQRHVKHVEDADGNFAGTAEEVKSTFLNYYKDKFRQQDSDGERWATSAVLAEVQRTVEDADNAALTTAFTAEEVLYALKKSPRGKSPGEDGLPAECYLAAWDVLGGVLTEVMNAMWAQRRVPPEVMQGVITLVPKVARPRAVKDFRPITLLDVDAKLLARLMVRRLGALDDKLLHPNQVRAGGARTMAGALCDLRDVISACGALRVPGAVLSIDFSGAFDAVHHDFLFEVLRRRGVAPHFVEVLQAMYGGATSQLQVNGELTQAFPVQRSVRQGCPLSALLFAVVLAVLLQYLDRRLQGLALANARMAVSAYADDAFFVLREAAEAAAVHAALSDFAVVAGLGVNVQKSGVLAVGTWDTAADVGFPYVETLKVLGVVFRPSIRLASRDNWASVLAGVRGVLRDNAARALGLSRRAAYVSTFALSKMWHVAQVLPVPKSVAADVTKAVRMFLWRGQLLTTSMAVACTPRCQGGLGVPAIEAKALALFTGRWQSVLVHDPDCFAGEWLHVLLGTFPLGQHQRRVWPAAWHFKAFHATRTSAAAAPPDVPARAAIHAIYSELVNAAPLTVPRVVAKAPGVQWRRVWENVRRREVPVNVQDSWWKAVHDLPATRHRLQRIGRSESRMCPTCAAPDTLAHRLARCVRVQDVWRRTQATLTRLLGTTATPRTLLQPDFTHDLPERRAVAAWVAGQHTHLVLQGVHRSAASFAAAVLRAKESTSQQQQLPQTFRSALEAFVN